MLFLFLFLFFFQSSAIATTGSAVYGAVIVEPRAHFALPAVILAVSTNLPANWTILLQGSQLSLRKVQRHRLTRALLESGRLLFQDLGRPSLSWRAYNALLKSRRYYDELGYDWFLRFETDSITCGSSPDGIAEFVGYDYIGAPWPEAEAAAGSEPPPRVGNGGFSWNSKALWLACIDEFGHENKNGGGLASDVFLASCAARQQRQRQQPPRWTLADPRQAERFSVENVYSFPHIPFGVHAPWGKGAPNDFLLDFVRFCPDLWCILDDDQRRKVTRLPIPICRW